MASLMDFSTDCFICRVMRSFAITGLGAGASGFVALYLGAPREEAVYWAFAGGIVLMGLTARRRAHRPKRTGSRRPLD